MKLDLRTGLAALVTVAALGVGGVAARANDAAPANPSAQYGKRIFAERFDAKGKSYACFVRRYDAAHLARHPKQRVKRMILLVEAELIPEDKKLNYSFAIRFNLRDRKSTFDSGGDCGHVAPAENNADRLHLGCSVDCDGGGFRGRVGRTTTSQLRVSIDRIAIQDNSKPDEDERDGFDGGGDDRVFRLDRTDLDACKPLIGDDKEPSPRRM